MIISLVVAASENNVIGKDGGLPWHLPMGRKTFESVGKPLPNRRNIIITRQDGLAYEGCDVVHSLEEAMDLVRGEPEVSIIGGGEIYQQAMDVANVIRLTRVHTEIEDGTAFFPEIELDTWELVESSDHPADEKHKYAFTFLMYRKK
jgi:dihydrofolate reductase